MEHSIEIYLGSPLENQSERDFLAKIKEDLQLLGCSALIFGNFYTRRNPLQVDFLIITNQCSALVELKSLTHAVIGDTNGDWLLQLPDGSRKPIGNPNPYQQAVQCKYALSDEVEDLVTKNEAGLPRNWGSKKFFTAIECVVCVFPSLRQGSKVPCDYKAKVLGYPELLKLLTTSRVNPQWNKQHWVALALHLGLIRQASSDQLEDTSGEGVRDAVQTYQERFKNWYGKALPRLVLTSWMCGAASVKADVLLGLILKNKHVQIAGPSGAGKTHLLKHMALFAQNQGHVVIFIQAKNYGGRLSDLLDFSIAHLHHGTSADLLQSCSKTSTPTALVVDGINECPAKLLPNLLQELQAFYLQQPMPILITSQHAIDVPQHLVGETMTSTDLTKQERQEILQCYSKLEISEELGALLEPFRTAFELSLAAESASEISGPITRAGLFERYTRRCLGRKQDNTGVRQVLIDMAALMNHRLVTSLPLPEVERLAHAREGTKRDQLSLLKEVLSSSLLEFHPGRCSFRHEMLQNFFEAEALLRDHNDSLLLATELSRPQNRHLAEFVVGMATDENLVRSCLHTLVDIALLEQSLLGRLGNIPRQLVHKDGASIIQAALRALGSTEFLVPESLKLRDPIKINGAPEWSSYESAVMRAIGRTLQNGVLIEEVRWLIQQTDQASGLCVAEEGTKDQPSRRRSLLFEYL